MTSPIPRLSPLEQMNESFHRERAADFPHAWKPAFNDVWDLLRELLPDGECLDDDIMQLFVDCLLRGIPEPNSADTRDLALASSEAESLT